MKVIIHVKDKSSFPNTVAREFGLILKGIAEGLVSIPFPAAPQKKWCKCYRCGSVHELHP